jgi:GlcNAc-PI de-N-acetylase
MRVSRRRLLTTAAGALASSGLRAETSGPAKLKVIVTGGHPGDPECGCAGTIARYTALGHDAALLYLNHGQGYCNGERDGSRCGEIRTAEAHKACQILKARPLFAGQYDGQSVVDTEHYAAFGKLLLDAEILTSCSHNGPSISTATIARCLTSCSMRGSAAARNQRSFSMKLPKTL